MMITEKGFVIPTLEEIYQRKLAEFKTVKPNIRETDSNVIIPLLKFDAAEEYDSYLEGLSVYNNLNVYTAVGSGLNAITSHLNMTWLEATRAKSRIQITASTETTIPQAWGVETVDGKKFVTLNAEDLKIQKGKTELDVISLNVGKENNVNVGQITKMTSIISGITSITNTLPAVGGKDKETDTELRERYLKRIDRKSSFTTEGIKNYILENTNVQKCQVIENDTDLTDTDGRLPHAYEAVCLGDTNENILQALYDYKIAGIRTVGDISKKFDDITVGFSRAIEKQIYVNITISAIRDLWLQEYVEKIKKIVQDYIDTIEPQGTIYLYKILGEIYKATGGIKTIQIRIGDSSYSLSTSDYILKKKEIAVVEVQNITVSAEVS